jgi:peptide/nickel transport system ATP-binding protein/oligopeptide transport system ATP-binding protein
MTEPLLEVRNLRTVFHTPEGRLDAVDGVSLEVYPGETLGIVGESGCGKSVTALSILRLVPSPPGTIEGGEILLEGKDLLGLSSAGMRKVRGNRISMIFQEPMTSLNPVFTIGNQIAEAIELHQNLSKTGVREKVVDSLDLVGMPNPAERLKDYPHQLSGGMRQRVMIAMALSCQPQLLIADEPTTALDVTIQAQILDLIDRLKDELGMSVLLITHDLGIIAEVAQRVAVMYAGRIVETCGVKDIFERPRHPYTVGLLNSLPRLGRGAGKNRQPLQAIPGTVPTLLDRVPGCAFRDRCSRAIGMCATADPPLEVGETDHAVACFNQTPLEA